MIEFSFKQEDEDRYDLVAETDLGVIRLSMNTHEAVELYDAVHGCLGRYIAERNAAKREYDTGIADDPTMQPVLDRIKGALRYE